METPKQTATVDALLRKRFKVTKMFEDQIMLARRYRWNTHLAQVGPDGAVNGETVQDFLGQFHD